ncbi:Upstream stimulatory factor2 [Porites harrisoni]
MATVDGSSSVEKPSNVSKESSNGGRETSADINNIQDGGHVSSGPSLLQQNALGIFVPAPSLPPVVSTTNGVVQKEFPALQNTTKPIPPSVFSYRFASPTSNQTPYYVSSDIVLSGGIAQQTRRRIVHNEVERRRKDKINSWIFKLADVVPQCKWGKQSKNIVLEKTVEYVTQVNEQLKTFGDLQQREQKLAQEVQQLKNQLGNITKENKLLKDLLKKHSIAIPRKILTAQDSSSSASNNSGITNNSLTMASPKIVAVSAPVSMTMPKTLCAPVQVPVNAPVVTMVTQVPITSASVTSSTNDMSKKDSIAYVTPFIIGTNPISMTTSTVATASPVVQVATPLVAQNVASDPGQLQLNQLKQNSNSSSNYLSNSHQSVNPQTTSDLTSSSTPQPLQTVNIPISSSQALQPHAGFSQHSVAAIMKVTLQPGMSNSG